MSRTLRFRTGRTLEVSDDEWELLRQNAAFLARLCEEYNKLPDELKTHVREMAEPVPEYYVAHEPIRGEPPVLCRHCPEEIEVYATASINAGLRLWRHVATGDPECVPLRSFARPSDYWNPEVLR